MFCEKCGKMIDNQVEFCRYCGASVKSPNDMRLQKNENSGSIGQFVNNASRQIDYSNTHVTRSQIKEQENSILDWLTKACGVVVLLGLFLPFVGTSYVKISMYDIFNMISNNEDVGASYGMETVTALIVLFFVIILGLAFAVLLVDLMLEPRATTGYIGIAGAVILFLVRISPNYIINSGITEGIGINLGVEVIQFGSGWWIILLSFIAVIVIGLIVPKIRHAV